MLPENVIVTVRRQNSIDKLSALGEKNEATIGIESLPRYCR